MGLFFFSYGCSFNVLVAVAMGTSEANCLWWLISKRKLALSCSAGAVANILRCRISHKGFFLISAISYC